MRASTAAARDGRNAGSGFCTASGGEASSHSRACIATEGSLERASGSGTPLLPFSSKGTFARMAERADTAADAAAETQVPERPATVKVPEPIILHGACPATAIFAENRFSDRKMRSTRTAAAPRKHGQARRADR